MSWLFVFALSLFFVDAENGRDLERQLEGSKPECVRSAIDVDISKAGTVQGQSSGHYSIELKSVPLVQVTPSQDRLTLTVIDPNGNHLGLQDDFGRMIINGRVFIARSVTVKAVSSHTYQGSYFPGEIQIEHALLGDIIATNFSAPTTESSDAKLHAQHRVIVSVPLTLGRASNLLRTIGLSGGYDGVIRDGVPFSVAAVDLPAALASPLAGPWVWYSGGMAGIGCPSWGVRWMLFQSPLEVSLEQLNMLKLRASGMSSDHVEQMHIPAADYSLKVFRQSMPKYAVDADETCEQSEEFNYNNVACWAQSFPACDGLKQSPIDLRDKDVSEAGHENFLSRVSWKPMSHVQLNRTDHNMQMTNRLLGYISLIGEDGFPEYYQTAQLNFHVPSEHLINGRQFAAELQVVHTRQKHVTQKPYSLDAFPLVITSFMFDISDQESLLLKQFHLSDGILKEAEGTVDLTQSLGPALDSGFYRYDGSFTTPDCHEDVKWFVFDHVFNMSLEQWHNFRAMYKPTYNNRPVQPLNGRKVSKNTFQEGTPVKLQYFLARNQGLNLPKLGVGWIAFPVVAAVLLMFIVMFFILVRDESNTEQKRIAEVEYDPLQVSSPVHTVGSPLYKR